MGQALCIQVRFLDPYFHGLRDEGRPEWPPSPMRLFQALVAAAHTGCRARQWDAASAEAFRWLERQPPPTILAPRAQPASAYTLFVPNNDADAPGKFERQDRLTGKLVRPQRLPDACPTVSYLWALDGTADAQRHARRICEHAHHVSVVGRGIDCVAVTGSILEESDRSTSGDVASVEWKPFRSGRYAPRWRVPVAGSLDDLQRAYEEFIDSVRGREYAPPRPCGVFSHVMYATVEQMPSRPYAAFELPDGVSFAPQQVARVAGMVRSLACAAARRSPGDFPAGADPEVYVAGHVAANARTTPPRFSYLPLPTIGHRHADGRIRRILVAEPADGDGRFERWAQQVLRGLPLKDEDGNHLGRLLEISTPASRRMIERYRGFRQSRNGHSIWVANCWSSVTPVLLPGFDRAGGRFSPAKADRLLLKAVEQSGIPAELVADVVLRKAPFWPGAMRPEAYFRPAELRQWPGWHVWIRFKVAVPGPLAIGAGRHRGLGLLAPEPVPSSDDREDALP